MNNIQLWAILVVFAFSGISWVFRKLKEQADLRAAKIARERQHEEMLRTGRVSSSPTPSGPGQAPPSAAEAQARLREVAQRRQQQLREIRRREQQAAAEDQSERPSAPKPVSQPSQPVRRELWPGGPVIVIGETKKSAPAPRPAPASAFPTFAPQPQRRAPTPVRTQPAPSLVKAKAKPTQSQTEAMRKAPPLAEQPRRAAAPQAQQQSQRSDSPRPQPARAATIEPVSLAKLPHTLSQWRAAIIANEVLSHPLGLREPESWPGAMPL